MNAAAVLLIVELTSIVLKEGVSFKFFLDELKKQPGVTDEMWGLIVKDAKQAGLDWDAA